MLSLFIMSLPAFFQVTSLRPKVNDAFNELSEVKPTLHFFNVLTGGTIQRGNVTIENAGSFTSDADGPVLFKSPIDNGDLTVIFRADGFIT